MPPNTVPLLRPQPQQEWVHSACKKNKLQHALSNSRVTAIEADIMMAVRDGRHIPVMAHPLRGFRLPDDWDVTFEEFLDRCIADGRRNIKLDFKQETALTLRVRVHYI